MEFSSFTFILTDDCNFNCAYCRPKKEKKYMTRSAIEKTVRFFYPYLKDGAYVTFFGGEPLLAFDNIKYAVALLQEKRRKEKKRITFTITTNGSLLTDEMLHFFDRHHFLLMLSFDGCPQDISRKPGSLAATREILRRLQGGAYPDIELSTNSVFTPATVNYLSQSLQDITGYGVTDVILSLVEDEPWDDAALSALEKELRQLTGFLVSHYNQKGSIPVTGFRPEEPAPGSAKSKGRFYCVGGKRRMAITPGEQLWGCVLFHSYLKNREDSREFHTYSFGKLDDFIKNHETVYPRVLAQHSILRQGFFFTGDRFCFLCAEVDICSVCPVRAAHATSFIGNIPPWICRLNRIQRKEKKRFLDKIGT